MKEAKDLAQRILQGDRLALAKGMTLVCSHLKDDQEKSEVVIKTVLQNSKPAFKIGVSGIGGVGKSSFIEVLGKNFLEKTPTMKLGVLTVDPSSPEHGGSILGDSVRMPNLVQDERVFLRSASNKASRGGLNHEAWEMTALFEGAGCDCVIIESVGAGQSDDLVSLLSDVSLLLQMPASGDNMQAIKKGSVERADMIIIHKNDGLLQKEAEKAALLYKQSQSLLDASHKRKHPPVQLVSSKEETGFDEVLSFLENSKQSFSETSRKHKQLQAFDVALLNGLKELLNTDPNLRKQKALFLESLNSRQTSPLMAARSFIKECFRLDF